MIKMVRTINTLTIELKNIAKSTTILVKSKKMIKIFRKIKLFYIKATDGSEIYYPLYLITAVSFKKKWMFDGKWKISEEQLSIK